MKTGIINLNPFFSVLVKSKLHDMSQDINGIQSRKDSTNTVNVQNNLQVKDVWDRTTVNKSMANRQDRLGVKMLLNLSHGVCCEKQEVSLDL